MEMSTIAPCLWFNGSAEQAASFYVSWQVVPDGLGALMSDPDPARAARVMQAMLLMNKLDLDAMRAAAQGDRR
jgi:predicted 3-demethylubiquinone-9 3-methyltransferase (glyoxalase superfamily)